MAIFCVTESFRTHHDYVLFLKRLNQYNENIIHGRTTQKKKKNTKIKKKKKKKKKRTPNLTKA